MKEQTTRDRVDSAFNWSAAELWALGFRPNALGDAFVRPDGLEVRARIDIRGELYALSVEGAPSRIIALIPPQGASI